MVMRRAYCVCLLSCLCLAPLSFAHHIKQSSARTMPVTTSSPKARDLFDRALTDYENLYLERANIGWRAAVVADPNFAVAYVFIAYNSNDPAEAGAAREKAKLLAPKASPGERLLIQWIAGAKENNFIAAISGMNDLLEMFPKDKRLAYLAGSWMMGQNSYEQAQKTLERALAIDKNYPPALNDLGYCYAQSREYPKAFQAMERYVAALPNLPNPQDSYAEILRMSGNFDAAIEHYQAALKIDPDFDYSQLGLGDTYALMGNQVQARVEYEKAIQKAHTEADRLSYALQSATTWARESNFAEADKAFAAVADKAHTAGFDLIEAQAHRMMSLYQTDDAEALKHLAPPKKPSTTRRQHFAIRPGGRTGPDPALPRGPRRSRRQPGAGGSNSAAAGDHGGQHAQRRGAEFVSRRRRNAADEQAESPGGDCPPGRG